MGRLFTRTGVAFAATILLSACQSAGDPPGGTYYECNRGTKLRVHYLPNRALVSADGHRALSMKIVPSVSGRHYQSTGGTRLSVSGRTVTWNTADRSAPQTCQPVAMPLQGRTR